MCNKYFHPITYGEKDLCVEAKYLKHLNKYLVAPLATLIGIILFIGIGGALPIVADSDSNIAMPEEPGGKIISIQEALSDGGKTVSVELLLPAEMHDNTSLELLVHTFQDSAWNQTINQCISLGTIYESPTMQYATYVFSNVTVTGNPDYRVTVVWREGNSCSGAIIDQMITGHYRVGTYDTLALLIFSGILAVVALHYLRQTLWMGHPA